jgi:hypothetical protein
MNYRDIFEQELREHNIHWCTDCKSRASHIRGFADIKTRTVHLNRKITTRSTLHRAFHEIGHIMIKDSRFNKRWMTEALANAWAEATFKKYGVPMHRETARKAKLYVNRLKRWGNNISKGIKNR